MKSLKKVAILGGVLGALSLSGFTEGNTVEAAQWKQIGSEWRLEDGVKNDWYHGFFIKSDGKMAQNEWVQDKTGKWYYTKADGNYARNQWVGGYYMKQWGDMAQSEWVQDNNGDWFYINEDGTYARNQWKGAYFLKEWGYMAKGEWVQDNGTWFYLNTDGSYARNQFKDGWYLKKWGHAIQQGWFDRDGDWYYAKNGKLLTNSWVGDYYLRADGRMQKYHWVDNYFVDENGKCQYNSWVHNSNYYVGNDGKCYFNSWVKTGNNWYYVGNDGKYLRNTTFRDGSVEYTFGSWGQITATKRVNRQSIVGGLVSPIISTSQKSGYSNDNIMMEYTPIPDHYAAERMSPVGQKVYELRVGNIIELDGQQYKVTERKTGITYNQVKLFAQYRKSSYYDKTLQTCDDVSPYIVIYKLVKI